MTDKKPPEEDTEPLAGQYTLFTEDLEHIAELEAQIEELEAHREGMSEQEAQERIAELRAKLEKQETKLKAFSLDAGMTEEQQEKIRQAAAIVTGKPAESYTLEQAAEIMLRYYTGKHPFGDVEKNLDLVHDLAIANTRELWDLVPPDALAKLKAGAQDATEARAHEEREKIGIPKEAAATMETIRHTLRLLAEYINSTEYQVIREKISEFAEWYSRIFDEVAEDDHLPDNVRRLFPYLKVEYEEMRHDPALSEYTLIDMVEGGFDREGNIREGTPFREAIERAMERQAEFEAAAVSVAEIERAAAEVPKLHSLIPTQHTMPNSTLMNHLAGALGKRPINAGAHDLPVIPATKKRGEITIYVMADYEPDKGITSSLTEYERDVSDAIMSIWEQAKREGKPAAFTTDDLYRAMPGRGEAASPQQKGAITKAVEKYIHLFLDIDATDELRKRRIIGDGDTYHIKDYYLRAQEHAYKAKGGQTVRAWLMTGEPLILNYARMTGQILTVPAEYLAIVKVKGGELSRELITMNAGRQAMTSYMLRRIAGIKHDLAQAKEAKRSYDRRREKDKTMPDKPLAAFRQKSDKILFGSIFKEAGTETTDRKQQMLNRNFCLDVLDFWKAKGYIRDYRQQTKGRSITGIEIIL